MTKEIQYLAEKRKYVEGGHSHWRNIRSQKRKSRELNNMENNRIGK